MDNEVELLSSFHRWNDKQFRMWVSVGARKQPRRYFIFFYNVTSKDQL